MKKRIKRIFRVSRYVLYKETLVDYKETCWSAIGAFIGIALIAFLQSFFLSEVENIFLIGSFGASCVLVFGVVQSPMSQPRNLMGGHLVSSIVGVTVCKTMPDMIWLTAPLAVSLSIVAMELTKTLHPPGGATALIAVIGSEKIKALGFLFVLSPVFTGCLILLVVAFIFNNLTPNRKYPTTQKFTRPLEKVLLLKRRYARSQKAA